MHNDSALLLDFVGEGLVGWLGLEQQPFSNHQRLLSFISFESESFSDIIQVHFHLRPPVFEFLHHLLFLNTYYELQRP